MKTITLNRKEYYLLSDVCQKYETDYEETKEAVKNHASDHYRNVLRYEKDFFKGEEFYVDGYCVDHLNDLIGYSRLTAKNRLALQMAVWERLKFQAIKEREEAEREAEEKRKVTNVLDAYWMFTHGLSKQEIARIQGVKVGTVTSRIAAAKKM